MKDHNYKLVEEEIRKFVEICKPAGCDTKLIFEVGFLTDEMIADLTKICCGAGVTYVKTATGSQAFPDIHQVKIMKENLSGDTKIKYPAFQGHSPFRQPCMHSSIWASA